MKNRNNNQSVGWGTQLCFSFCLCGVRTLPCVELVHVAGPDRAGRDAANLSELGCYKGGGALGREKSHSRKPSRIGTVLRRHR